MSPRCLTVRTRQTCAAATAVVLLTSACSSATTPSHATGTLGAASSPATTSAATSPAPGRSATCSNAQVVKTWSLARLAARVVAVPVLDFKLGAVRSEIRDGAGGILFLGNRAAPVDLRQRVAVVVAAAPAGSTPLVMADEEGGGVQRLAPLVSALPWPRDMARTMTAAAVRALARRTARQIRAAGVTVDLAPVADVDSRPGPSRTNPDGSRSFSGRPAIAAAYTVAFQQGLRDGGVLPVVKHFPGLGGAAANTDLGPAATLPLSQLSTTGLVPFRAAVAAGAPAVMVSNASVPGLTTLPASLSRAAVHGLLRHQLGFDGMVVTDSLSAGAVLTGGRTLPEAVVAAVAAGADLVLFGSTLTAHDTRQLSAANLRRTFAAVVDAITAAVRSGRLRVTRLRSAATTLADAIGDRLCG